MTSTVSPVGSDPSSSGATPQHAPSVDLPRRGRIRRIAEEEHILVILLAGFGLIFLFVFPPALIVNDSWLNLMAGREVVENGLPSVDDPDDLRPGLDLDRPAVGRPEPHVRRLQPRRLRAPLDLGVRLRRRRLRARRGSLALAGGRATGLLGHLPTGARRGAVGVVDPRTDAHAAFLHRARLAAGQPGASAVEARLAGASARRRLGQPPRKRRPRSPARSSPRNV